jgi:TonB-linked SusC/RagA family outer membrane protein
MKLQTKTGLIVLLLMLVGFAASAQNVTGKWNKQSTKTVLKEIEAQTGLSIFYRSEEVDENAAVTGEFNNVPVEKVLQTILGKDIAVTIDGRMIVLTKNEKKEAKQPFLRGKVIDTTGESVPGAGVFIKGTTIGVSTDLDGNFQIAAQAGAVLAVSSLGYKSTEITVGRAAFVTITLEPENEMLDELIVVGYGTTKKTNLTGAVSVIKADELKDRSALDVGHMLQGSVPGLNVTSASGRPGQAASLNIRGWNSINGGSPLVLIDGVEGDIQYLNPADVDNISVIKDAAAAAIYGAKGSAGVILVTTKNGTKEKDGRAKVSYSGRFGVTSPTTSTDYETRGYNHVYLTNMFWAAYSPGTKYANYSDADMQELWIRRNDKVENPERPWVVITQENGRDVYNYYANTDWYHELYNDIKPTTNHMVTMSGATGAMSYLVSGGYLYEQGMFKQDPDHYSRVNMRVKLGFDVNDWLRIGSNLSYFNSSYFYPGQSGINNNFAKSTVHTLASYPARNPDGSNIYTTKYNGYEVMDGLLMLLNSDHFNEDKVDNLSETIDFTITPVKGLAIKGDYTYLLKYNRYLNRSVNGTYSKFPGEIQIKDDNSAFYDVLTESANTNIYQAYNLYGTYETSIAEDHNFKLMAGVNYETRWIKDLGAKGYNLYSTELNDQDLVGADPSDPDGKKRMETSGGQNELKTAGYFTRFNYDYKGRYLLELNARYDGSSRFLRGSRWVFSPSASFGWKFSEEPFFKPLKNWWDNGKFRVSYGQLGNQQLSEYYPAIRTISTDGKSSYLLGGANLPQATLSAPVSSGLTWERSIQGNVGLDLGFLGNRLTVSAEAYIRDTKDMLTAGEPLPAVYGASVPKENTADLRTNGYEFTIGWRDSFNMGGKPFNYGASIVFSDYISHITRFNNPKKLFAKTYWVGQTYGEIWGYHVDGLFATDADAAAYPVDQSKVNDSQIFPTTTTSPNGLFAGEMRFVDLDGDGAINKGAEKVGDSGDWRIIGNSEPRYNYGLNLNASWNGFDFAVFFQGIGKMDWYPPAGFRSFWFLYDRPYQTFIPRDFQDDCWSESNPNAYYPRPHGYVSMNANRPLGVTNDRYLQNIGFLRLKNLTFGYTLPENLTKKFSVQKMRIYFTGENLFYFAPGLHGDFVDPEMAQTGGTGRIYPWQKSFNIGIDITL